MTYAYDICICMHIQAESDGSATMTDGQLQWVNTMKSMVSQKADKSARRPTSGLRRACFALVSSRPFDFFITGVVVANIAAMACDYFGIEQDVQTYYYYLLLMSVFSYTYYCEAALKLTGLGPMAYFRDSW